MKLVQRGPEIRTGAFVTIIPHSPQGSIKGEFQGELMVNELGKIYGYLWVEADGRLSYESVIEDPLASDLAECMTHEANKYMDPSYRGIFPEVRTPVDLAWRRQGKTSNQIYSKLMWMPQDERTTDDATAMTPGRHHDAGRSDAINPA